MCPSELILKYGFEVREQERDMRINESIYFTDKNSMQLYLQDLDIMSTMTYKGMWTKKYADTKSEIARKGEYPLRLCLGDKFTSIISNRDRIYTFGEDSSESDGQISKI